MLIYGQLFTYPIQGEIDSHTMVGEGAGDRDKSFRMLLISISTKLTKNDVETLGFMTNCPITSCERPLELLIALWKKELFSPLFCSPLAQLLQEIYRHDLAAEVTHNFVVHFPDHSELWSLLQHPLL